MNGAPGNASSIARIAHEHALFLVEDCAQCVGGSIGGRNVGTLGDMAVFSFQVNKNMSSGEAGCVVTNDDLLFRRAQACHDSGYSRDRYAVFQMMDEGILCIGARLPA